MRSHMIDSDRKATHLSPYLSVGRARLHVPGEYNNLQFVCTVLSTVSFGTDTLLRAVNTLGKIDKIVCKH